MSEQQCLEAIKAARKFLRMVEPKVKNLWAESIHSTSTGFRVGLSYSALNKEDRTYSVFEIYSDASHFEVVAMWKMTNLDFGQAPKEEDYPDESEEDDF